EGERMAGPAANKEPVVDHMTQVWASLISCCERLTTAEWGLVTDCPGWTVKDQLSHLVGIERMLLGDPPPPPLVAVPGYVTNAFGEMNEACVEARRAIPGDAVSAELADAINRRIDELRAMPTDRFDQVGWSPVGEVPYREFMETRVIDTWAHEQDIRRSVGRPGGRNGVGESAVLVRCEQAMPFVVGKRVAPPDGTSVLFSVRGLMGRQVYIEVHDGRAEPRRSPSPVPPSVTLAMDQEVFWMLGMGRSQPARVVSTGQVIIDGDMATGRAVLESMAFMI
ncbi:MAG TPA: maleylpyruvate isomerase N-terminal domain-containing protein, partial [Acidimicrobiales bacterium]|nr:maleylpyruvate isomerase N-terminal domain-containing protein [Acidimicrobiales bacterium]